MMMRNSEEENRGNRRANWPPCFKKRIYELKMSIEGATKYEGENFLFRLLSFGRSDDANYVLCSANRATKG